MISEVVALIHNGRSTAYMVRMQASMGDQAAINASEPVVCGDEMKANMCEPVVDGDDVDMSPKNMPGSPPDEHIPDSQPQDDMVIHTVEKASSVTGLFAMEPVEIETPDHDAQNHDAPGDGPKVKQPKGTRDSEKQMLIRNPPVLASQPVVDGPLTADIEAQRNLKKTLKEEAEKKKEEAEKKKGGSRTEETRSFAKGDWKGSGKAECCFGKGEGFGRQTQEKKGQT